MCVHHRDQERNWNTMRKKKAGTTGREKNKRHLTKRRQISSGVPFQCKKQRQRPNKSDKTDTESDELGQATKWRPKLSMQCKKESRYHKENALNTSMSKIQKKQKNFFSARKTFHIISLNIEKQTTQVKKIIINNQRLSVAGHSLTS